MTSCGKLPIEDQGVERFWYTVVGTMAMAEDTFITYTHPSQQADRRNRRKVASYIGTHFRNRSKPAARKACQRTAAAEPVLTLPSNRKAPDQILRRNQLTVPFRPPPSPLTVPRDTHGLRDDPFSSFPIEITQWVPGAIDYCIKPSLLYVLAC